MEYRYATIDVETWFNEMFDDQGNYKQSVGKCSYGDI